MRAMAAVAMIWGGAAAALPIVDGVYDVAACGEALSDLRIEVRGEDIAFFESSCAMTNPVNVRDMGGAVLYDAVCTGEGEGFTRRIMVMAGPDGRAILVQAGFATTYRRCGD